MWSGKKKSMEAYPYELITTNDLKNSKIALYRASNSLSIDLIDTIVDEYIYVHPCISCGELRRFPNFWQSCWEPLCIKCTYLFFFSQFDNTRYETGIPSLCMDCSYAESIEHLHHFLVNHKPFYIFLSELQLAQICYNYTISSLTIYYNDEYHSN